MYDIDAMQLRVDLIYDAATGAFYRSGDASRTPAGTKDNKGYIRIYYRGKTYAAHRLAWLYITNGLPIGVIDHINGDRSDNRIINLRDVSSSINNLNKALPTFTRKKSEPRGITKFVRKSGVVKYVAQASVEGWLHYLGTFDTLEDAQAAYNAAKAKSRNLRKVTI